MKKMLCCAFAVMIILSACGRESESTFEQYVIKVDSLADEDLSTVFSEKQVMDELIVGQSASTITDDRWQKGISNDSYHASNVILGGHTATITITQEDGTIKDTDYVFSPGDEGEAKDIIDSIIVALGEPDVERDGDDVLSLYWDDPTFMLMFFKSTNQITVS